MTSSVTRTQGYQDFIESIATTVFFTTPFRDS